MTTAVQQLLESFDALSESEKHRAAVEILRRVLPAASGDVPESALVEAADELFRALDAEEAAHAWECACREIEPTAGCLATPLKTSCSQCL